MEFLPVMGALDFSNGVFAEDWFTVVKPELDYVWLIRLIEINVKLADWKNV